MALLKVAASGEALWARGLSCHDCETKAAGAKGVSDLSVRPGGEVVATGIMTGNWGCATAELCLLEQPGNDRDLWVCGFDPDDGSRVWFRRFPVADGKPLSLHLATPSDDRVFVGGKFQGTLDLGSPADSGTTANLFLARLGPTGKKEWAHIFGAAFTASSPLANFDALVATDDGLIASLGLHPTGDAGGQAASGHSLVKYSHTGSVVWVQDDLKRANPALALGPDGALFGLALTPFDSAPPSLPWVDGAAPTSDSGGYLLAYDALGEVLWARSFGAPKLPLIDLAVSGDAITLVAPGVSEPLDIGLGPLVMPTLTEVLFQLWR